MLSRFTKGIVFHLWFWLLIFKTPLPAEAAGFTTNWTSAIPSYQTGSIAISDDGTVYFPDQGGIRAFTSTGSYKWETLFGELSNRSSVSVTPDGGIVASGGSKLISVSASGVERWRKSFDLGFDHAVAVSADGTVYAANRNGSLYAISVSGVQKWAFVTGNNLYGGPPLINGGPAIGKDGTIYCGASDGKLYALNPDGSKLWEFDAGTPLNMPPSIASDGTVYIADYNGMLRAISPGGVKKWQFAGVSGSNPKWPPSIAVDGTVYYPCLTYIYALSPAGAKLWQYTDSSAWTTPVVLSDGSLYLTGSDRFLVQLNPNGTLRQQFNAVYPLNYPPAVKPDGTIHFSKDNTTLVSLNGGLGTANSYWPMFHHDLARTGQAPPLPSVDWIMPANGMTFVSGQSVPLQSKISNLSPVDHVDYFVNGSMVGSASVAPYQGSWIAAGPANVTLLAIAFSGSTTVTSAPISLNIVVTHPNLDPVSAITDPVNGMSWVAGQSVSLTSSASDPDGIVVRMEFYDGAINIGTQQYPNFKQNIVSVSAGIHHYTSVAIDNFGARSTSAVVNVFAVNKLWEFAHPNVNATFKSPATGSNGVIYAGASDAFYAIQPNGQLLWTYPLPTSSVSSQASVANDGTIYFGDSSGFLHAVMPNGVDRWKFAAVTQILNTPAIDSNGNVYFGNGNGQFFAISPSGQKLWQTNFGGYTPSIAGDGTIYVANGSLHALNNDGSQKWSMDVDGGITSTPAVGADGTVYFGAANVGMFYALDPSGSVQWKSPLSSGLANASPVTDANLNIYFGTINGTFYSLSWAGKTNWSIALGAQIDATPLITEDGTILVPCSNKKLFAVSSSGVVLWTYNVPDGAFNSCGITATGTILMPAGDNKLVALENSSLLARGAWPMAQRNPQHRGQGLKIPPIFLTSPLPELQFEAGSAVSFTADLSASELPIVNVDYLSNSNVLVSSSSSPFNSSWTSIPGVHFIQARGTDSDGAMGWSTKARIKVVPAGTSPSFLVQPSGLRSGNGSNIVLAADVFGSNPLTFQWYKDGVAINGATASSLQLTNVSLADSAHYELNVSNPFGTNITAKATVSVLQSAVVRWSAPGTGSIHSAPAIGPGSRTFFTSDGGYLFAFGPLPTFEWYASLGSGFIITTSPSIALDGTIYAGTSSGRTIALNPDGNILWNVYPGGPVNSSPAIGNDGMIYIGNRALYPDGTAKWQTSLPGGTGASSPAIAADGTIYVCSAGNEGSNYRGSLYALDPNGTIKWSFLTGSYISASPAIGADGTIYFGSLDKKFYAIRPDGTKLWEYETDAAINSSAAIGKDGRIYFGNDGAVDPIKGSKSGGLYVLDTAGRLVWLFRANGSISSSPAITREGVIYFGCRDNKFYALNSNGTEKWEFEIQTPIDSSPNIGADGTIYFGGVDAKLYALAADQPLADSSWPMFRHDPRHTGNVTSSLGADPWQYPFTSNAFDSQVATIAVIGSDVYVGGSFHLAGGLKVNSIARWDGVKWNSLGEGVNGGVGSLAVIGTNLYVGGSFTMAGSVAASNIARWDGSQWYSLSSGLNDGVSALAISNSTLIVAGDFTLAGGQVVNKLATWDGLNWASLGRGLGGFVSCVAVAGQEIYIGGSRLTADSAPLAEVAHWNGSAWEKLGSGLNDFPSAMAVQNSDLYVVGRFVTAGGITVNGIARWNGTSWSSVGGGVSGGGGPTTSISAIAVSGSDIYVGGFFTVAGNVAANCVARWDGTQWNTLASGVSRGSPFSSGFVASLAVQETNVFVGGTFQSAGGDRDIRYFGKYSNTIWSSLGTKLGFVDGRFQFLLQPDRGLTYGVEVSTNLINWERVITFTNINSASIFVDDESAHQKQRFYRTVTP